MGIGAAQHFGIGHADQLQIGDVLGFPGDFDPAVAPRDGMIDDVEVGLLFGAHFFDSFDIMSAKALLDENPNPTRDEIIHHMDGNICRCTGYVPIVAAIQRAAQVLAKETRK